MSTQNLLLSIALVFVLLAAPWVVNAVKFIECDFEPSNNYKCEVVHGIGVFIYPASIVTVWLDYEG